MQKAARPRVTGNTVYRCGRLADGFQYIAAVWAMAADTEAEADRLFASRALWRLSRDRGIFELLPSPEEAADYPYTDAERTRVAALRARALAGMPDKVVGQFRALSKALDVEEIVILTTLHDPAARRRSYTLLAEAAGLSGAQNARLAAE